MDKPQANGKEIIDLLKERGATEVSVETVAGERGDTDSIKILIAGSEGKSKGGHGPTLRIVGKLREMVHVLN